MDNCSIIKNVALSAIIYLCASWWCKSYSPMDWTPLVMLIAACGLWNTWNDDD